MIPLTNNSSTTTQSLVIALGGSASTTYPTITVSSYIVPRQSKTVTGPDGSITGDPSEYRASNEFTLLTSSSQTTISAAPNIGDIKDIIYICVYNADTAACTVTVSILDNATARVQVSQVLQPNESLLYEGGNNGIGWHIL